MKKRQEIHSKKEVDEGSSKIMNVPVNGPKQMYSIGNRMFAYIH